MTMGRDFREWCEKDVLKDMPEKAAARSRFSIREKPDSVVKMTPSPHNDEG